MSPTCHRQKASGAIANWDATKEKAPANDMISYLIILGIFLRANRIIFLLSDQTSELCVGQMTQGRDNANVIMAASADPHPSPFSFGLGPHPSQPGQSMFRVCSYPPRSSLYAYSYHYPSSICKRVPYAYDIPPHLRVEPQSHSASSNIAISKIHRLHSMILLLYKPTSVDPTHCHPSKGLGRTQPSTTRHEWHGGRRRHRLCCGHCASLPAGRHACQKA